MDAAHHGHQRRAQDHRVRAHRVQPVADLLVVAAHARAAGGHLLQGGTAAHLLLAIEGTVALLLQDIEGGRHRGIEDALQEPLAPSETRAPVLVYSLETFLITIARRRPQIASRGVED